MCVFVLRGSRGVREWCLCVCVCVSLCEEFGGGGSGALGCV